MRILIALLMLPLLQADEGLWPYNQFPTEAVKTKYGFDATPGFLNELQLSSVRMGTGGSGAFVSPNGLMITTRAMINGCLANVQEAFSGERPCPNMEASVLVGIEDVSSQLKTAGQTVAQRNAAIAKIESDCAAKTGNVCTVLSLFSGGRYDLYRYKRYSDVRLIFAPESSVAFFGKERDSITYLRYGLNISFLRAYEGGKPANTPHYLKWSAEGVKENDLVFTAGNPNATARAVTAAQLTFYRDTALPLALTRIQARIRQLGQDTPTDMLNGFKTDAGKLIGLRDDRLVIRKTVFEQKIRRAVEGDSKLGPTAAKVWDDVAAAYKKWTPLEKSYQILESAPAPGSKLFRAARRTVRGETVEASAWVSNDAVEKMMLARYLDELKALPEKTVPIKNILNGKTSAQAAEAMIGPNHDAIINLAKLIDGPALHLAKQHEEIIGSLEVTAAEKIAQYRFRLFGAAESPDGTGTPRVEFGTVVGYTDRAAVVQPFASTFSGLYYRQNNEGPWQIPQNWIDIRKDLNAVTPLDFVSTCDTGGGEYGGAVVNREGKLVGITFDGNLESLPNIFLYSSEQARAVHVDVRGIAEALEKVYKATDLLRELGITTSSVSATARR